MKKETTKERLIRLEQALELISHLTYRESAHLGRPRLTDLSCIFCVAQLSIQYGGYGEYLTTETLASEIQRLKEE